MGTILTCDTDAAWSDLRRKHVTSTRIADIAGLGYNSALATYHWYISGMENGDNKFMRWGRRLQDDIAEEYELQTGLKLSNPPRFMRHDTHEWVGSSFDYFANQGKPWLPSHRQATIVEVKTGTWASGKWGPPGTDQIPEGYLLQCQWQMLVAGLPSAEVAVLFMDTRDFGIYPVPRDDGLIETLVDLGHTFWLRVCNRQPPDPDWEHPDTGAVIRRLYGGVENRTVELTPEDDALLDGILESRIARDNCDAEASKMESMLLERVGDAACGAFPSGRKLTRRQVHRKSYVVSETTWIGTNLGALLKERKKADAGQTDSIHN
jgi:putative phage-type endonuclease